MLNIALFVGCVNCHGRLSHRGIHRLESTDLTAPHLSIGLMRRKDLIWIMSMRLRGQMSWGEMDNMRGSSSGCIDMSIKNLFVER